jgi:hypothetical protein
MNTMQQDLNKTSNTLGGFVDDIRQTCTTSQVQTEIPKTQEPFLQPCRDEADFCDEGLRVFNEEEVQGVEEIAERDEDEMLSPKEVESNDEDEYSNEYDLIFEDVWGETKQTNEEEKLEQVHEHTKSQEEVEASESLCDKVSNACEESNEENKCSKEDNSIFEDFWEEIERMNEEEESERILQKDVEEEMLEEEVMQKEISRLEEEEHLCDEGSESEHEEEIGPCEDSSASNCNESSTFHHEPTPPSPKPINYQTIHYTQLKTSGVMFIDLPPQEGVNLGIELPLSTRLNHKLLQQTSKLQIPPKIHGEYKKPQNNLLTPCELLQGFAHMYDPFERG